MKRLFDKLISTLPYLFVFIGSLWPPIDADLGWHLKYGEYFYTHLTPLRENIYSTMMPNYRWPNSSWVTDIISFTLFKIGGFLGLSIGGAIVVTLTFLFIAKAFRLSFLKQAIFFPIILFLELPVNNVSLRGQQISLLFLAILLYLLNTFDKSFFSKKIKRVYLIPILFIIWANVHGEFLLGLGVLGVWITGKVISDFLTTQKRDEILIGKKKQKIVYESPYTSKNFNKSLRFTRFWIIIFILSVAATFIDPFGFTIYQEAFVHIGNSDLKYIAEYLPFNDLSSDWRNIFLTGALLLIGTSILFLNGKLVKKLPNVLVVFVLFFLAIEIKRFAWPFYYTTPAVLEAFIGLDKVSNKWTKLSGIVILLCSMFISIYYNNPLNVFHTSWSTYCNSYIECSPKSAEFLSSYKFKQPLWTNYNWGGWLIWNYPKIKPSIDGRMHLWNENGYSAFDEYYPLEQNIKDIDASKYNTVYAWRAKIILNRLNELVDEGRWKYVYVDDNAVVAERIRSYESIKLTR